MARFGSNFIIIEKSWTDFIGIVGIKFLSVQYDEPDALVYQIFAVDDVIVYLTTIWKGTVPASVVLQGYSQVQNDADKTQFEASYKDTANQPVSDAALADVGTGDNRERRLLVDVSPAPRNHDAFGRFRVSEPSTIFNAKHTYDSALLHFVSSTAGSAQVVHNLGTSDMLLQVTGSGARATYQTKRYFNYQSGKSQQILASFNFDSGSTNNVKRVGYFDNDDGIFTALSGSDLSIVRRSRLSNVLQEEVVPQVSWSIDSFDGQGPSGVTLDVTKTQIFNIDFEWLGAGNVRAGFVVDGNLYLAHEFLNANHLAEVYMRTPNLPVRWETENAGGAATTSMSAICCSVQSEGGQDPVGVTRSADRGLTPISVTTTSLYPIISIRLRSSHNRATVIPIKTSIVTSTGTNFLWQVIFNPTVTGGAAASWQDIQDSAVQYDISRTGTLSNGIVIASGYAPDNLDSALIDLGTILQLASDYAGTSDEIVVAVRTLANPPEDFFGSITWFEVA